MENYGKKLMSKYQKKSMYYNGDKDNFGKDYRVATLSKFCQTVSTIIIPSRY